MLIGRKILIEVATVAAIAALSCTGSDAEGSANRATAAVSDAAASSARETPAPVHGSYSLEWVRNDVPNVVHHATPVSVHLAVKNTGGWMWPDPPTANPNGPKGKYAVRLGYRWMKPDGTVFLDYSGRVDLATSIKPGQIASFTVAINPPPPGNYKLQFDLVEELVRWFADAGAKKLEIPVRVD